MRGADNITFQSKSHGYLGHQTELEYFSELAFFGLHLASKFKSDKLAHDVGSALKKRS